MSLYLIEVIVNSGIPITFFGFEEGKSFLIHTSFDKLKITMIKMNRDMHTRTLDNMRRIMKQASLIKESLKNSKNSIDSCVAQ